MVICNMALRISNQTLRISNVLLRIPYLKLKTSDLVVQCNIHICMFKDNHHFSFSLSNKDIKPIDVLDFRSKTSVLVPLLWSKTSTATKYLMWYNLSHALTGSIASPGLPLSGSTLKVLRKISFSIVLMTLYQEVSDGPKHMGVSRCTLTHT